MGDSSPCSVTLSPGYPIKQPRSCAIKQVQRRACISAHPGVKLTNQSGICITSPIRDQQFHSLVTVMCNQTWPGPGSLCGPGIQKTRIRDSKNAHQGILSRMGISVQGY